MRLVRSTDTHDLLKTDARICAVDWPATSDHVAIAEHILMAAEAHEPASTVVAEGNIATTASVQHGKTSIRRY